MCPQGTYSDKEGVEECRKCPVGTYTDEPGRTMCKSCPPGTFQVYFTVFQDNSEIAAKIIHWKIIRVLFLESLEVEFDAIYGKTGQIIDWIHRPSS